MAQGSGVASQCDVIHVNCGMHLEVLAENPADGSALYGCRQCKKQVVVMPISNEDAGKITEKEGSAPTDAGAGTNGPPKTRKRR